jgi:hypothetical protein
MTGPVRWIGGRVIALKRAVECKRAKEERES